MQILEKTKNEIESKVRTMSDFLRMEYLELCSKKFNDIEILRYCYKELSDLYEKKFMYAEALKYVSKLKGLVILRKEKVECILKEIELLIKNGFYNKADIMFLDALRVLDEQERFELKRNVTNLYNEEAKKFERVNKNTSLLKVYESLISYVRDDEVNQVKKKMIESYKRLGRVRESLMLEKELDRESKERIELA
jgi:hypothetical protein